MAIAESGIGSLIGECKLASDADLDAQDVVLPCAFNAEEVAQGLDVCLLGMSVVNGLSMPLFQFLSRPIFSTSEVDGLDLLLVATQPSLVSLRSLCVEKTPAAWRLWRKIVSMLCAGSSPVVIIYTTIYWDGNICLHLWWLEFCLRDNR